MVELRRLLKIIKHVKSNHIFYLINVIYINHHYNRRSDDPMRGMMGGYLIFHFSCMKNAYPSTEMTIKWSSICICTLSYINKLRNMHTEIWIPNPDISSSYHEKSKFEEIYFKRVILRMLREMGDLPTKDFF